jgi:type I restriction enzyme, S subunit
MASTEFASPSAVPSEWRLVRIGSISKKTQYGLSVRGEQQGTYPILRMNALVDGHVSLRNLQFVNLDTFTFDNFRLLPGDLLFNRTNSYELVGRSAIFEHDVDAVFASYLVRIQVDRSQVDPRFLNYALNWDVTQRELKKLATRGVGQSNISASKLLEFLVHLPDLPEQVSIADVLDRLRNLLALEARQLKLSNELKRKVMGVLFTRGLRGEGQRVTEFGPVPATWGEVALNECATIQTGAAKGRKFSEAETVDVPYLRVANVQDGHLDLAEIKHIRIRRSEIERYRLKPGDVVLTEGGDFDKLGRGFVWRGELDLCMHQNHVFAVRTHRDKVLPEFFAYLAQSEYGKAYFLKVAHKTTNLACINSTKLKSFPVLVPPTLDEQSEIIAILGTIDQKIELHKKKGAVLNELFRGLLYKLMTGEIRAAALDLSALEALAPTEAAA